jgi:hypothetical protein
MVVHAGDIGLAMWTVSRCRWRTPKLRWPKRNS